MVDENPYVAPQSEGEPRTVEGTDEYGPRQLSPKQLRWLVQSQYALRALYVLTCLYAFINLVMIVSTQLFYSDGPGFGGNWPSNYEIFIYGGIRFAIGAWCTVALRRLDRSLTHILQHNAARVAVNRAIRLSRNALIALLVGFAVIWLYGMLRTAWAFFFLPPWPMY